MLKKTVILLTLIMLTGCETFVVNNKVNTTMITWTTVDDVKGVCNKMFREHNIKQLMMVDGCAIWKNDFSSCTIITGKTTTQDIVGHEIRHCFEGHFHH